jgi:mRNA-degrading endonuclease RelE of RelBE toxin-antitoxin system
MRRLCSDMDLNIKLDNPCNERKDFCVNCHSHFMAIRPLIKGIVVSKHFIRDLKDEEKINSIIKDILDCSHLEFNELHKFEEHINGNLIFRAKKEQLHIVYCINKNMRLIFFLRAIKHFSKYKRFLENKKQVKRMIESLS